MCLFDTYLKLQSQYRLFNLPSVQSDERIRKSVLNNIYKTVDQSEHTIHIVIDR